MIYKKKIGNKWKISFFDKWDMRKLSIFTMK